MNRDDLIVELQERYRQAGRSLNERQRRHWAATEATRIGRGGITIVSRALRMSPNTIKRGIHELATEHEDAHMVADGRIRKSGGGRKTRDQAVDRVSRTTLKRSPAEGRSPQTADSGVEEAT
jgi:hypothetical protein